MHFLRYPNPLWFLQAGEGAELQKSVSGAYNISASAVASVDAFGTTILFDVSAGYRITASAHPLSSVDIALSSFAYNITASVSQSTLVLVSADNIDGPLDGLFAKITATPVYELVQSGQTDTSTSAAYNVSATFTASLFPQAIASAAYNVSASTSAAVLIYDVVSASVAFNITASVNVILVKAEGQLNKSVAAGYNLTASTTPIFRIGKGGGLVWGRKKRRYIPVRVGSVNTV